MGTMTPPPNSKAPLRVSPPSRMPTIPPVPPLLSRPPQPAPSDSPAPARRQLSLLPILVLILIGVAVPTLVLSKRGRGGGPLSSVVASVDPRNVPLRRGLASVLSSDPRNKGVDAAARYIGGSTLAFDLRGIDSTNSMADVMRVLFQFAEKMKGTSFEGAELQFRGSPRFKISGADFKYIGSAFATENPVYLLRTFPEKLRRPDGTQAFGKWEGGLLGVAGKQMEDLAEFHRQWYLNAMLLETKKP
jgi:hypothetical protein